MQRRIVLKFGGSFLTDKSKLKTISRESLSKLAETTKQLIDEGWSVILVHGAGSFGHITARKYRLSEGKIPTWETEDSTTQEIALNLVRENMLELNMNIVRELSKFGVNCTVHPPHTWARNSGPTFSGGLERFSMNSPNIVHITYGDVVDCDDNKKFGILSGDDLAFRLATELLNVEKMIFVIGGGVEGIMTSPPNSSEAAVLIPELTSETEISGFHDTSLDVTGGISLKINRALMIASRGINTSIISGNYPKRIIAASRNEDFIGTIVR